ncbi:MAG: toll/interleukin-1 receptor domain-containing protein [Hyphomonadaceae bacterium]
MADGITVEADAKSGGIKYSAFISYSHKDAEAARRLHRRLEGFRMPKDLAPRRSVATESRPLGRVFLDRAELSAASNLSRQIQLALEQSDALVVLCSRSSAVSRYVADEIRYFRELGRSDRVFAVILDGEPYASIRDTGNPDAECLPAPCCVAKAGPRGDPT